ncbi:MAG: ATP-binding cassette domain-containing protein [Paenibacillaceae bacterium]|nr:ATP-binding cassette domain-containing protein [Paenibacillaceae bacterium]
MAYLFRSVFRFLIPHKKWLALFFLALLFELSFEYFTSLCIKYLIDDAIAPRNLTVFFALLVALLVGGILNLIVGVGGDYAMSKLNETILIGLRSEVYEQTQRLSARFYSRYRIGDIVARFTIDIPAVEHALMRTFSSGILSALSIVVGSLLLFTLEWKLALIACVGIALMFVPQRLLRRRAQRYNEDYIGVVETFSNRMDEEIKAFKLIRGFQLQDAMKLRFRKMMQTWFTLGLKKNFVNSNLERLPIMVLSVLNAVVLGVGGYFTFQGGMTVGDLIAFYSVFDTLAIAVITLIEVVPDINEGEVSMRRVNEVLDIRPDLEEREPAAQAPSYEREITFDRVTFGYSDAAPVIRDLSAAIPVGRYVALVGPSGSGKSTMLQLLMRFYDPQSGSIRMDGIDLRSMPLSSLLQQTGVVFQEPYLFQATIRDNLLTVHPGASEEELVAAARAADVHDAILRLEDGYDTLIENDGANLSVSLRNRIAVARAMLRRNELMLLDEVAAALDPESEVELNQTLAKFGSGRTVIAVSHRLRTVAHADRIYFIQQGAVVESGTHDQLLARKGAYARLWAKQQGFRVTQEGKVIVEAERLKQMAFFSDMNEEQLDEIAGLLATEQVAGGQHVFRQGEPGHKFYIIVRGKVEVSRRNEAGETVRMAVLQDGDHFGEIALLNEVPRTADITALADSTFLTLTRGQLLPLLDRYEDIKVKLYRSILERTQEL